MPDKFLKTRVPESLYATLLAEAGASGKRLNTHVRELLQQHAQAVSTAEAVARIEASITVTQAAPQPGALDHDSAHQLAGPKSEYAPWTTMIERADSLAFAAGELSHCFGRIEWRSMENGRGAHAINKMISEGIFG